MDLMMVFLLGLMYLILVYGAWDFGKGFVNTLRWNEGNGFGVEDDEQQRWEIFFSTKWRRFLFAALWPLTVPTYFMYWYRRNR